MGAHVSRFFVLMFLLLSLSAIPRAAAWDYIELDLPAEGREADWRDKLAEALGGQTEVRVEGGRIDVMTDTLAIEVDWPHKWHEGIGQALHYADHTGKQGVLALIAYGMGPEKLQVRSQERFKLVEDQCRKNGLKLLILFPTRPATDWETSDLYWYNRDTDTRHNSSCRYYKKTRSGRLTEEKIGKPCSVCGG